jgi:thiamine-phosphate pyrophosphorylase
MRAWLSKLYPILDSSVSPGDGACRVAFLEQLGMSMADAGVRLLEYRNKTGTDAEVLADAQVLRRVLPVGQVKLVLDDRVDVALAADFDGVHVDTGDLPVEVAARLMKLSGRECVIGTSVGNAADLRQRLAEPVDYIAFGPVYPTTTKQTTTAPIGIEGVRRFREMAGPKAVLVAAAGITLETAPEILAAGADAVAIAAAIFRNSDPAEEFRRWMAVLG